MIEGDIGKAALSIRNSGYTVAFTGAGISVESGIPPFRGPEGLWAKYDPSLIEISRFYSNPELSWGMIREVFYDFIGKAKPNAAHYAVADLEKKGYIHSIITQNIDNLHQEAGSKNVYEYHGTTKKLRCVNCHRQFLRDEISLEELPPRCPVCKGVLKPEFVFFGEPIPDDVNRTSFYEARKAQIMLIVGTTGEIMPASLIPYTAKDSGCEIIEVNVSRTVYTDKITDIFLPGRATEILARLAELII